MDSGTDELGTTPTPGEPTGDAEPAARPARGGALRTARFVVGYLFGLGILYWLVRQGRLDLRLLLETRSASALAALFLTQLVSQAVLIVRWWLLATPFCPQLDFRGVYGVYTKAYVAGLVLPGAMGLDGVRLVYAVQLQRRNKAAVAASMFMDRFLGIYVVALLATASGLAVAGAHQKLQLATGLAGVLSVISTVVLIAGLLPRARVTEPPITEGHGLALWWRRGVRALRRTLYAISLYRAHPGRLAAAFVLSVLATVSSGIGLYLAYVSTSGEGALVESFLASMLLIFLTAVPLAPRSLGVAEGVGEVIFGQFGLTHGSAAIFLQRCAGIAMTFILFAAAQVWGRSTPAPEQQ